MISIWRANFDDPQIMFFRFLSFLDRKNERFECGGAARRLCIFLWFYFSRTMESIHRERWILHTSKYQLSVSWSGASGSRIQTQTSDRLQSIRRRVSWEVPCILCGNYHQNYFRTTFRLLCCEHRNSTCALNAVLFAVLFRATNASAEGGFSRMDYTRWIADLN